MSSATSPRCVWPFLSSTDHEECAEASPTSSSSESRKLKSAADEHQVIGCRIIVETEVTDETYPRDTA